MAAQLEAERAYEAKLRHEKCVVEPRRLDMEWQLEYDEKYGDAADAAYEPPWFW